MRVRHSSCESCGTELLWIDEIERRPLERKPCPREDGEQGYLLVRRQRKLVLVPSVDHPNAREHLRIHTCYIWLAERRDRVDSLEELLTWAEQIDEQQRGSDARQSERPA